ncbi:glycosyltransferase family 4 protein [Elstera cyanobacteriorum]|uniref:glycosyltransferase family 4 protein n=1 Tax=Elstera cyanobacteriorum TaxID=2022747 RepID=UPI002355C61D|nr:glycosyltransferase family 4 protein [Elstera cyanobacteriorum]MCK6442150.1 glycosyltransferase family 4 protein [Elstera cyanobacteriorum]
MSTPPFPSADLPASRPAVILQVLPALKTGGVERTAVDIAVATQQAGCRALVASAGGPMVHEMERSGAKHITLPLDTKNPWRLWRNAAKLAEIIEREGVDIVHARSRAPAWSAYWAARRTGRPFLTTFAGIYNFKTRLKRAYNAIMQKGELVIANSQYTADHVHHTYHTPLNRIRTIPRGVDLALFDPARMRPDRLVALAQSLRIEDGLPVVMMPGRVTRWKGHRVLVEAIARMERRDFQCLFIGSDEGREEYRGEIEALIRERDLGGIIRFAGQVKDMSAAYMLADLVISASTDPEAFGRVVAEAQAMGRPVIATDHGGARETVLAGESGWLVAPGDAEALAAALTEALALPTAVRTAMGARGQEHIRANFSKDRMCADTLQVYNELLERFPVAQS